MKRLFSILSAAVMLLSIAAVIVYATGDGKTRGDVNGDGKVDSADALLVMKYDAGLTKLAENEIKRADLNGDGKVDSCDAVYILRIAAGLKVPDAETTAKETSSVSEPTTEETTESTTENTTKPTEPVTKPTEPVTKPTEPVTKPTEPVTKPTEPTSKPTTAPATTDPNWDPSKNAVIDWGGGTTKKN